MKDFAYSRAQTAQEAQAAALSGAQFLAGGTTLVDLARCGVARPSRLVDISRLPGLDVIEDAAADGGRALRLGALVTMARAAENPALRAQAPAVAQSLELAASPQIRNMATLGGNLMQRARCPYFRDPQSYQACNKRSPGSGCSALGGPWKGRAVLGASEACVAAYPGDLAVALSALDAMLEIRGPGFDGARRALPVEDFFLAPADRPERETMLAAGELIEGLSLPISALSRRSVFLKARDRASYEFASASVAAALELAEDGTVAQARIALGGLSTRPWRARAAEEALIGRPLDAEAAEEAGRIALSDAASTPEGGGAAKSKIPLGEALVARALLTLADRIPGETA